MKKKVYRIFINFIDSQEKWLNKMAIKGYRLKKLQNGVLNSRDVNQLNILTKLNLLQISL